MEQIAVFEEKVVLSPNDFRKNITSFDGEILQKLKEKLEGKCSQHGFVKKDSLELLSRSLGVAEKGRFTSEFIYYCKTQGIVYNPPDGYQVEGEVMRKNKMGLYVILDDAIRIMIPRDLHLGNDEFDSIEIGDKILIEIKKSRYQVNDTHILSIGQFIRKVSLGNPPAYTAAVSNVTTEQEAEEE
jgi:DNA-directed RNA polymerase subunit E'/Rpb7